MVVVNGYASLVELKDWVTLGDTIDDVKLERAITASSRGIDNFTQRHFWQTPATPDPAATRVYDACDPWVLDIDDLISVVTLKTDDNSDGVFETTWAVSDYQLLSTIRVAAPETRPFQRARAVASRVFPQRTSHRDREGRIEIVGVWGWPAIPAAVNQACLLVAARLVKRKESPEGVSGFDEFGVIRISSRDDPDAVRLLEPYWNPASVGI